MKNRTSLILTVAICALLASAAQSLAQAVKTAPAQTAVDLGKIAELTKQNRYLEALPLLEKLAATNPTDAEFWADYSLAIQARSLTLDTAEARRRERIAARAIAVKAQKLGSTNLRVLELIEKMPEDGGGDFSDNAELNKILLEAEQHFQIGEYAKALTAYERALKLDPDNYAVTVYAGDTFYARKMYKEAEPWFARAVKIDPDRELALRFWGDALMQQNKVAEARDKYVDALIADRFSRLSWEKLVAWAEESGAGWNPLEVAPPGGKVFGEIEFDEKLLKAEDGTKNWLLYRQTREEWKTRTFKREFPAEKEYRRTLREETTALRRVAEAAKQDSLTGKVKILDQSLANLIRINDAGLLEAYVLFPRSNEGIAEDYDEFRKNNRDKLRRFIVEFLVGTNKSFKV